jgi:hypothetical protein
LRFFAFLEFMEVASVLSDTEDPPTSVAERELCRAMT